MKDETSKIPGALLLLVSIGPGDLRQMTVAARKALGMAEVIIGYHFYVDLVRPLLDPGQEVIVSPIGDEVSRAEQAVEMAASGRSVALISSGDIGIYAMAGPVFEVLRRREWQGREPEIAVLPGVSAVQAAAARLGAPLSHDFCTISLSDLLTPWPVIERRLQAAAWGDFVIAFYNPRSRERDWQLARAIEILLTHRPATTPVAVVRNVTRPDEAIILTTLADLNPTQVDMFTLVLVGNSQSYMLGKYMATPRGYTGPDETKIRRDTERLPSSPSPLTSRSPDQAVYPVTLTQVKDSLAVVIGGGPVGERKVRGLLRVGARVHLVSPQATATLQTWAKIERICWQARPYRTGDLAEAYLVFAATNQRTVNAQVAHDAVALGLLCNVADKPDEGTFHLPAVHYDQGLIVAISTAGQSPGRARRMRDQLAEWLAEDL